MGALAEYGVILLVAIVLAVALFVAVRLITRGLFGRDAGLEQTIELQVLDAQLARGEITKDEYERAKRALGR